MSIVGLQFVRGAGWSSSLIAWFGAARFSHVDIVLDNGQLLGARWDKTPGDTPSGVRIRPPNYESWADRLRINIPCSVEQHEAFYDYAIRQVGKPYDASAIFAFAWGRDWHDDRAWYCSELAAACLEQAKILIPPPIPLNKVTPGALAIAVMELDGQIAT